MKDRSLSIGDIKIKKSFLSTRILAVAFTRTSVPDWIVCARVFVINHAIAMKTSDQIEKRCNQHSNYHFEATHTRAVIIVLVWYGLSIVNGRSGKSSSYEANKNVTQMKSKGMLLAEYRIRFCFGFACFSYVCAMNVKTNYRRCWCACAVHFKIHEYLSVSQCILT